MSAYEWLIGTRYLRSTHRRGFVSFVALISVCGLMLGVATTWISPHLAVVPQVALMALLFFFLGLPCLLVWAGIGAGAGKLLAHPAWLRAFNIAMPPTDRCAWLGTQ